jgi:hypothetical protein
MGFLDKVKATAKDLGNAAKDVKGEIEKTGLLDSLKQQSQNATSETTGYSTDSDSQPYEQEEPWDIATLIKERTGVDPGTILSTEEVTRLTGIEVQAEPGVGGAENFTGRTWRGQFKKDRYSFDVNILHDYIGDRTDDPGLNVDGARTRMEETRGYFDGAVDVPGVGDEAFFDGSDYLYARRGRWTLMLTAATPKSYDAMSACKNLAIQAFNNLPA